MAELISSQVKSTVTITFVIYTIILLAIAVIAAKRAAKVSADKYVGDFFTGGRNMGVLSIAFITAAGLCSASTFVGGPAATNSMGLGYAMVDFTCYLFMTYNVYGTIGKKMAIVGRRINAQTYMDVLKCRYNNNKLILGIGAVCIIFFLIPYCSVQFIGGARLLEVIAGLDYKVAITLFAVVVIAYSSLGGISGVGLATVLQGTVMTVGALALGIGAVRYSGGLENIFHSLEAYDTTFIMPQSMGFWLTMSYWIAFGMTYLSMPHGALGSLSYKNTKTMHTAMFVSCAILPIWAFSLTTSGLASVGIFGVITPSDQTTPLMAATILNPVLAGITIAGAAAAAQSTIAAMLLTISGTIVRNIFLEFKPQASPKSQKKVTTAATLLCGLATFIFALDPPDLIFLLVVFAVSGLACGFFWPMLLGLYWPRMNEWGAAAGLILGIGFYVLSTEYFPGLALGVDPMIISLIVSLIGCIAGSLLTKAPSEKILRIFWGAEPPKDAA